MKKFRIKGDIKITYTWRVDEEVEVEDNENSDDAFDIVIEDLDPLTAFDTDTDTFGCDFDVVDDPVARHEAERAAELLKLQQWNEWARGQVAH